MNTYQDFVNETSFDIAKPCKNNPHPVEIQNYLKLEQATRVTVIYSQQSITFIGINTNNDPVFFLNKTKKHKNNKLIYEVLNIVAPYVTYIGGFYYNIDNELCRKMMIFLQNTPSLKYIKLLDKDEKTIKAVRENISKRNFNSEVFVY